MIKPWQEKKKKLITTYFPLSEIKFAQVYIGGNLNNTFLSRSKNEKLTTLHCLYKWSWCRRQHPSHCQTYPRDWYFKGNEEAATLGKRRYQKICFISLVVGEKKKSCSWENKIVSGQVLPVFCYHRQVSYHIQSKNMSSYESGKFYFFLIRVCIISP